MTRLAQDKDTNRLVAELVGVGWAFHHGRKHDKLVSPTGGLIIVSRTPSDWRTLRNLRSEVKKKTG